MEISKDLRKILSRNIKAIRGKLHISQAKLAEYAEISHSYLTDIERCRTWVSDKTLQNLAKALNREVWELFFPGDNNNQTGQKMPHIQRDKVQLMVDLIIEKREILHRTTDQAMKDIITEIKL